VAELKGENVELASVVKRLKVCSSWQFKLF
jgi:hypothetical protein